ncbi:uncharacterized protein LOC111865900 isoform X2 [Cryptotermes secundus]|uniref:uncharacterized protein LOC111865900 isoform X2 n=1 Tax=Cryptotermes secundus TaxID=105785 RepID=UPI000CD7D80D|nr:uncharacterized protein LOC111865900 isoform X2 [Cryptotermes secundus]
MVHSSGTAAALLGITALVGGPHVLRMCSDLSDRINDCKMANGVQYCFCSGSDLCNGNVSQFPTRPTVRPVPQPPSDEDDEDRDLPEGSGGGFPRTKANPSPTTAHPPHGTTSTSVSPTHGGATTIRTLCLLPFMAALVVITTQ